MKRGDPICGGDFGAESRGLGKYLKAFVGRHFMRGATSASKDQNGKVAPNTYCGEIFGGRGMRPFARTAMAKSANVWQG